MINLLEFSKTNFEMPNFSSAYNLVFYITTANLSLQPQLKSGHHMYKPLHKNWQIYYHPFLEWPVLGRSLEFKQTSEIILKPWFLCLKTLLFVWALQLRHINILTWKIILKTPKDDWFPFSHMIPTLFGPS